MFGHLSSLAARGWPLPVGETVDNENVFSTHRDKEDKKVKSTSEEAEWII